MRVTSRHNHLPFMLIRSFATIAMLLLISCASGPAFEKQDPGKLGILYVFRVFFVGGMAQFANVTLDEKLCGDLPMKGYVAFPVTPGEHTTRLDIGIASTQVKVNVPAGGACYVRIEGADLRSLGCGDQIPNELKEAKNQSSKLAARCSN
ncbi:MAG: hypothetical protein JNM27_10550 [Leptospirales bacterium]|nr:hypothetical protein [Leptospirales bacterium]